MSEIINTHSLWTLNWCYHSCNMSPRERHFSSPLRVYRHIPLQIIIFFILFYAQSKKSKKETTYHTQWHTYVTQALKRLREPHVLRVDFWSDSPHNPPDKLPLSPCNWEISVLVNGKAVGMLPKTCDTHTHTHTHTHRNTLSLSLTHGALVAKVSAFSRQNKGVWKGLGNYRRMCISVYTAEPTWRQLLRAQFKSTTGRPCVRRAQLIVQV